MFNKIFSFIGRATRSEYWAVTIIANIVGYIFTSIGVFLLGMNTSADSSYLFGELGAIVIILGACWAQIATMVRRCRDAGINVWWTLAAFIPYISYIVIIVFGCLPSSTNTTANNTNLSSID